MDDYSVEIENLTSLKNMLLKQSIEYAKDLKNTIVDLERANLELQDAYLDTVLRLVMAAEYRDRGTGEHIARISRFSVAIAGKLNLPQKMIQHLMFAAPMHDIGKIGIPDNILLKEAKLTEMEYAIIKQHCTIGAKLLSNSKSDILCLSQEIAMSHHERWDGLGYPKGLTEIKIPIGARIVALADVYDALTTERPYKEAFSDDFAIDYIINEREKHFDPEVVDVFLDFFEEIVA